MLPGGLWQQGEVRRDFQFAPLSGEVELGLATAAREAWSTPRQVTEVLALALRSVGGVPADREAVRSLCVADRQYLMGRLAARLGWRESWIQLSCPACAERFELAIRVTELPVKPAGEGYPFAAIEEEGRTLRLRVPNGADQEAIAGIAEEREARRVLAGRCLLDPQPLSPAEVERAEEALEAVAPEMTNRAQTACPECGAVTEVPIDPYFCLDLIGDELFEEIHRIASTYHWSEPEILRLQRERRRLYLQLIDRS